MALKALFFFAAVLAVASAGLISPLIAGDDGSYWPGKYDLRELHPDLPSVRGGLWAYPYGTHAIWA